MAGRPGRKTLIVKDIEEEKGAVENAFETKEIKTEPKKEVKEAILVEKLIAGIRKGTVKTDPFLNIRNKPSFQSEIIGKLYDGDVVDIYEVKNNFGKIAQSEEKWVSLDYVIF